jgi:hypothetical protein
LFEYVCLDKKPLSYLKPTKVLQAKEQPKKRVTKVVVEKRHESDDDEEESDVWVETVQGGKKPYDVPTLSHVWCKVSPRPSGDGKARENKKNQEGRPKSADGGLESREDEGTDYEASQSIWRWKNKQKRRSCKYNILIASSFHLLSSNCFFLWNDLFLYFVERSIFLFFGTIHFYMLWNVPFLYFVEYVFRVLWNDP